MISPVTFELLMGFFSRRLPMVVLVLANLVPLYGVIWGDWDAGLLVLLYWAENLIIGFYSLLKIVLAGGVSFAIIGNLFVAAFFCLHYGGFVAGHGALILEFVPLSDQKFELDRMTWPGHLMFLELLLRVVTHMFSHMTPFMKIAFLVLFISHGVSFVVNYLLRQEFRYVRAKQMMFSPYARIFIMHIALVCGAVVAAEMGSPLPLLILLVALKIGMDMWLHFRSHHGADERARGLSDEQTQDFTQIP